MAKHRKGETILETLIAMGVLLIGIMMASTIMSTSIRNINSSKNRVVAVNIAKEGLEAIRNIRDTNWLKFNSKKRECWNHDPKTDSCDGVNSIIGSGDFIVYKEPITDASGEEKGWKWRLESLTSGKTEVTEIPTDGNPNEFYIEKDGKIISYIWNGRQYEDLTQLYVVDVDPNVNSDEDTAENRYTNDRDTYNHALVREGNALGKDLAVRTNFRRQISIKYLTDDGMESNSPSENRMVIRAKVTWQEGKNEFSTDLATHLADYMDRENL